MSHRRIQRVAVLGAGTMGAQIAAHLANAGVRVDLLDVTVDVARAGLTRAMALKPDPFFTRQAASLVEFGGFDLDLARVARADWVIEAIIEEADAKHALLAQVDGARTPGSIVSSNTSGIPLSSLAGGRTDDFRRHWLGTHFFNPPRYLHLLEIIPTPETDGAVIETVEQFADCRLGKGVVIAKDSPGFIANRLGLFGLIRTLEALATGADTIEEIDAMTGPALGRPRSATFRTMDIAGIDVIGHVITDLAARVTDPAWPQAFAMPALVPGLIARGWIGEKTGRGFYRREGSEILTLDPKTMGYRPRQAARLSALGAAQAVDDMAARTRQLFLGRDRVGEFLRATLGPTLVYSAQIASDIAHSIDDVDRAMRWGFGWPLGPFEIWDAVGVSDVLDAVRPASIPPLVADLVAAGRQRFRSGHLAPSQPAFEILKSARNRQRIVRRNAGASLVDLGDGALAVEFHSKLNTLGADAIEMLHAAVTTAADFSAIVIGNDAPDFSAGANLVQVLVAAQNGNWDELDQMVRAFQGVTEALRYAPVPVVACPAGRTLGGGCEVVLHAGRVQAAAETYLGLVEAGVGLVPAGGGTKEMLARATAGAVTPDLLPVVQRLFETIGLAKVSTSAAHARTLGFLRAADGITMNRDRLIFDAKMIALACAQEGYQPPTPRMVAVGGETLRAALELGVHLAWRAGRLTDHDAVVGRALANVLAGGSLPHRTTVTEAYLLDLEREAFLKLCGEAKTRERIQHTLETGKPLRN